MEKELADAINQTDEIGIRVDEKTIITLEQKEKKIMKSKKAYQEYLKQLFSENGMDPTLIAKAVDDGKTETTIYQPKLKIVRTK